jgi:hypothetical protein
VAKCGRSRTASTCGGPDLPALKPREQTPKAILHTSLPSHTVHATREARPGDYWRSACVTIRTHRASCPGQQRVVAGAPPRTGGMNDQASQGPSVVAARARMRIRSSVLERAAGHSWPQLTWGAWPEEQRALGIQCEDTLDEASLSGQNLQQVRGKTRTDACCTARAAGLNNSSQLDSQPQLEPNFLRCE